MDRKQVILCINRFLRETNEGSTISAEALANRIMALPLETGAPKGCITNEDVGYATAPSSVKFRNPPASPAATPITLCNGKPCAIAGQLDKQLADTQREAAELRGKLEAAESALATAKKDEREIRNAALEEAAVLLEPKDERPCDCTSCDCGNSGDAQRVAVWDSDKGCATMIRALKEGA